MRAARKRRYPADYGHHVACAEVAGLRASKRERPKDHEARKTGTPLAYQARGRWADGAAAR